MYVVRFVEIEPFDGIEGDTCTYIDMDLITKTVSRIRGESEKDRERERVLQLHRQKVSMI